MEKVKEDVVRRKEGAEFNVIIAGNLNVNRCNEAERKRVKGNARLQVGCFQVRQ